MIRANLRFVVKIAHDYAHFGVPILDLIAEGNIGLMKAVERFDPERGGKLSTYAAWWIKQAIKRALTNQGKTIRIPVHMVDRISRIRKAKHSLESELGREPTTEEIAIEVRMPVNKVAHLVSISVRPASLQAPISGDDASALGDLIGDENATTPAEDLHSKSMFNDLRTFIANLDDREREILRLRFGLGGNPEMTLEEIGDKLSITRERVRQIQDALLTKLRESLEERENQLTNKDIKKEALAVAYHKAMQGYLTDRRSSGRQTRASYLQTPAS
ncbi:MAG: hypothetical protein B7X06_03875 [Verrucomicrobia bacterium 21-51-4]|nr:MAG: hypothetical protein B7X06_03875 [Verrucomicrobia bacterium 21-51-4]